jgi:hypothetical protein
MALNHKYTLVCDEVRREDNGKLIVVGLYTAGIVLSGFPLQLPKLTFLTCLEPTTNGTWDLTFRFSHVDTGALIGPEGRIRIEVPQVIAPAVLNTAVLNTVIAGPSFQLPGNYTFTLTGANFEGVVVSVPISQQVVPRVH